MHRMKIPVMRLILTKATVFSVVCGLCLNLAHAQCAGKADCNSGRVSERPAKTPSAIQACNRAQEKIWVSIAYPDGLKYFAEGWWSLRAGQCKVIKRNIYGTVMGFVLTESGGDIRPSGQSSSWCIDRRRRFRQEQGECPNGMESVNFGWLVNLNRESRTHKWSISKE